MARQKSRSKSKVQAVKTLNYNCDYGGITVQKANKINGQADYVDINIGSVSDELWISSDYGSIDIKELEASFNNLDIETQYTGVNIGYKEECDFNIDIKTSYGVVKLDNSIIVNHKSNSNFKKDYQGYYGAQDTSNSLKVSSSYGGIKIFKN